MQGGWRRHQHHTIFSGQVHSVHCDELKGLAESEMDGLTQDVCSSTSSYPSLPIYQSSLHLHRYITEELAMNTPSTIQEQMISIEKLFETCTVRHRYNVFPTMALIELPCMQSANHYAHMLSYAGWIAVVYHNRFCNGCIIRLHFHRS